jgi:hypothetical protein
VYRKPNSKQNRGEYNEGELVKRPGTEEVDETEDVPEVGHKKKFSQSAFRL